MLNNSSTNLKSKSGQIRNRTAYTSTARRTKSVDYQRATRLNDKFTARDPQSSHLKYMVILVKILLILLILFMLPKLVTTRSQRYRKKRVFLKLRAMRLECQTNLNYSECPKLLPEESLNCANKCISASCYDQIYGSNPLEPGEIDLERSKQFDLCAKKEFHSAIKQAHTIN